MARKRDEKSRPKDRKLQEKAKETSQNSYQDKDFVSLKHQLSSMGLTLREIAGDGNCLFGALADQLDGNTKAHHKHRQNIVSYMRSHREDFEPFVEDNIPFERHLSKLAELGNYGGNDCIVAFARLSKVKVVIHQLNTPLWQIDGNESKTNTKELHISYHNGDHYSSVRKTGDSSCNPANIKLNVLNSASGDKDGKASSNTYFDKTQDYDNYYAGYGAEAEAEETLSQNAGGDSLAEIMKRTGCDDVKLVQEFFRDCNHDVWETIDAILNYNIHREAESYLMAESLSWDSENKASRVLESNPTEASKCVPKETRTAASLQAKIKLQPHISNAKRKEYKKQLRKLEADQRKRYDMAEARSSNWNSDEQASDVILVKDMECLSI